ncbi:hypothetical protein CTAYLR_010382 [Chrysophaeum taylorii]|uniref:Uncharacterized protein n=1 Tax=Chrysophaeum taylorii TaxID=2483200 RepID=A0AAD7XN30_9STRA|nr:hypothetical protein CTAYLR_010382 [Chrysophaeum taylorii]
MRRRPRNDDDVDSRAELVAARKPHNYCCKVAGRGSLVLGVIVALSRLITRHPTRPSDGGGGGGVVVFRRPCVPFVTVVLPSVVNPAGRSRRLAAIAATWGARAHAIFVEHSGDASGFPEWSTEACDFPRRLEVPVPPSQGVARLRWVLTTVNETDFAFMVNDHTAVVPENLACYLRSLDPAEPLYLGHALVQRGRGGDRMFNSGAAGYVLSRASLRLVARAFYELPEACGAAPSSAWLQGNPGLVLATCLASQGVLPGDTRAADAHRFNAFGLVRTATGRVDDWYERMHERLPFERPSLIARGPSCCATHTISFHYVEAVEQYALRGALDAMAHFRDVAPENIDAAAEAWLDEHWPRKDLGGYARPLPRRPSPDSDTAAEAQRLREDRAAVRDVLLHKIRIATNGSVCRDDDEKSSTSS